MFAIKLVLRIAVRILNIIIGLGLLASCYAGCVDPRLIPFAAVVAMAAPLMIIIAAVMLVIDLIWYRRRAIFLGICMLLCSGQILENFPVNFGSGKLSPEEKADSWTLLSYNTYMCRDVEGKYPDSTNRTVSQIIAADADVVCLFECYFIDTDPQNHISRSQADTVRSRYPYRVSDDVGQTILSKYPLKPLQVSPTNSRGLQRMIAYTVDIRGRRVALFLTHLQSMHMDNDDITMFSNVAGMKERPHARAVKRQLIDKIEAASVRRAGQAEQLLRDIREFGGENVVVCGDFNDVPGSWSLRRLADAGLKEVYPEVGLGYMRTYNSNRMYFRIDHVLYRGNMRAVSMHRGDIPSSDHFPLLTTFLFTPSENQP